MDDPPLREEIYLIFVGARCLSQLPNVMRIRLESTTLSQVLKKTTLQKNKPTLTQYSDSFRISSHGGL